MSNHDMKVSSSLKIRWSKDLKGSSPFRAIFMTMKNKELLSTFSEYDNLKKRYLDLVKVKKRITLEIDLEFVWECGTSCWPTYSANPLNFIESKIKEYTKDIDKDIKKLWGDLEKYSEKNNICPHDLMESFEESTN
jgi:hypothetical protein